MNTGLRAQALERMRQIFPEPPSSQETLKAPKTSDFPGESDCCGYAKSADLSGIQSLLEGLGLDRDQLILLAVLAFLYFDHADTRILLAVLYIML